MPSKPAVLPLAPTTPFERAQVRFLLRLWTPTALNTLEDLSIATVYLPVGKALRDVCEKYRKAPTKWPVDALIVHPKIYKLMEERFSDSPVIFQLQQALLLQGLLNKRKRGELKPRPSGMAKKKAAKKGK
jgi:hypothetical protein